MEYGLLLGIVAFLLAAGFYGYKRGIINIVLSLVAMVVTAILATMLTAPVGAVVKTATPIYDNIYDAVYENVKEKEVVNADTLENLNLPEELTKVINDKIEESGIDINGEADKFMKEASEQVANAIFKAGVFLVLFIILYIVIKILIKVLDVVAKLPLIKEANKLGGFIAGLCVGLILVWIACLVLMACSNKEWAIEVYRQIDDNKLLGFIYNSNPLTKLFTNII